jgi:PadR family transcriptional regulator AphA
MKRPSVTSAALLGQLAMRDQSPYELAKAMSVNLRFFWPRAESHVYREVKRLVSEGWAIAESSRQGRRTRTTYSITSAGRRAMAAWLASPPGGTSMESEPLVRVFLGADGTVEDLLAAIRRARSDAEAMLAIGSGVAEDYLAERHPFQEHVHLRAFTFDYLFRWAELTVDWADRAEAEVKRWRGTRPSPAKHARALARIAQVIGRGTSNPRAARRAP